jgi:hypothetical protein
MVGVRCERRHTEEGGGEENGARRLTAMREQGSGAARVGRSGKGGSWAGPESNNVDFDLKRILKLNMI